MKYLKILLFFLITCPIQENYAQNNYEQVEEKYEELQQLQDDVKKEIATFQKEQEKLNRDVRGAKNDITRLEESIARTSLELREQMEKQNSILAGAVKNVDRESKVGLSQLAQKSSKELKSRSANLVAAIILVTVALLLILYFLKRKLDRDRGSISLLKIAQEKLQRAQVSLQEESLKLDNQLLQLLEAKSASVEHIDSYQEPDHTLAKKVAEEITRMEFNLSRMDSDIKGYKQLKRGIDRIRNNFMANGYEIVEMLGKPYVDGVKAITTFISDPNLEKGTRLITKVIKPQINFNGVLIQSAEIEVTQAE